MSDFFGGILLAGFMIGGTMGALFVGVVVVVLVFVAVTAPFRFLANHITWGKKR
jgi:hypothetical protein